jgi:hypothetical protein
MPTLNAGCTGYEDFMNRDANIAVHGIFISAGLGGMLFAGRKIYKGANALLTTQRGEGAALIQNNEEAVEKINEGLFEMGMGALVVVTGFISMMSNESTARSNCCDALPADFNCTWNK